MLSALVACSTSSLSGMSNAEFERFYEAFKRDAEVQGLNGDLLDQAFGGTVTPYAVVLKHDKSQPETTQTFASYLAKMMVESRRKKGAQIYQDHLTTLMDVEVRTGVPGNVLVALWGIESNFGANMGGHPVIPALVTLAWSSEKDSRKAFFRKEALVALQIATQQRMEPRELIGSWAGAMGGCQFMPSTYLKHATDGDGDGKTDIWANPTDVFASSAQFLKDLGWRQGKPWRLGATVTAELPSEAAFNERGLSEPHSIGQWQRWGVVPRGQAFTALGSVDTLARVYRPMNENGPAFMVGPNFDVILKWNKSSYFAASVLLLAESVAKNGDLPRVD